MANWPRAQEKYSRVSPETVTSSSPKMTNWTAESVSTWFPASPIARCMPLDLRAASEST